MTPQTHVGTSYGMYILTRNHMRKVLGSIPFKFVQFFRGYFVNYLSMAFLHSMIFGWAISGIGPVVCYLNSAGVSCVNCYNKGHQIYFLSLVFFAITAGVHVMPLNFVLCGSALFFLPALFGFMSARLLINAVRVTHRSCHIVESYIGAIRKMQLLRLGKQMMHPLPPLYDLEELLLRKKHWNGLAMKSLRLALATAISDLDLSLLSYSNSHTFNSSSCDFGDISVASLKLISKKSEQLFAKVLVSIVAQHVSCWLMTPVGSACPRAGAIAFNKVMQLLRSGLDIYSIHHQLLEFEQRLLEMMPGVLFDSQPPIDEIIAGFASPRIDGCTLEQSRKGEVINCNINRATELYGDIRRQIFLLKSRAEDFLMRLCECEQHLMLATPDILCLSRNNRVDNSLHGICESFALAIASLSGHSSDDDDISFTSSTPLRGSLEFDWSTLQDIISNARLTEITHDDTERVLDMLHTCVLLLHNRNVEHGSLDSKIGGHTYVDLDMTQCSKVFHSGNLPDRNGVSVDLIREYKSEPLSVSSPSAGEDISAGDEMVTGQIEVITGEVMTMDEIKSVVCENNTSSMLENSRWQRRQLMVELNSHLEILRGNIFETERRVNSGIVTKKSNSSAVSSHLEESMGQCSQSIVCEGVEPWKDLFRHELNNVVMGHKSVE